MLALFSGGLLLVQLGRGLLPNLLPTVISSLSITPFLAGVALSLMSGLHAVFQYPGGRLSDRLSRKTVLVPSLAVAATGFGLIAVATTYPVFLVGVAVAGVGSGLFYTPMRSAVADLFVERRGQALGISQAAGSAGSVCAAGLAVVSIGFATWQTAFVPVVVALGLLLVALHLSNRDPYVVRQVGLDVRSTGTRLFADRNIRWVLVTYSLFTLVFLGVTSFLPTYLQVEKSFGPGLASGSYALVSVASILFMPLSGRLSDSGSRPRVAAISVLVGAMGLAALVVAEATPVVFASVFVFAAGMSAYAPVMQAYLLDGFTASDMGGDFGAVKTVYTALGSVGPLYLGYMAGTAGYSIAFATLVVGLVCSAVVAGVILEDE